MYDELEKTSKQLLNAVLVKLVSGSNRSQVGDWKKFLSSQNLKVPLQPNRGVRVGRHLMNSVEIGNFS